MKPRAVKTLPVYSTCAGCLEVTSEGSVCRPCVDAACASMEGAS
jgi:hypothetical protein